MSLLKLAWKNLINKPLAMLLSLMLFGLGVGLVVFLLLLNKQVENNFENNLAKIDCVVGAKGSPMQLILSSMYHIDAPTGNIPIASTKAFFNPKHPLIKNAVPLSLGDNYRSFRIVGTEPSFIELYKGEIGEGKIFENTYEVCVGQFAANKAKLKIGDQFFSSHGLEDDGLNVHDHGQKFKVVGILKPSGTVLDQLILCNSETVWAVHDHDHEDHDHEGHEHEGHEHGEHDHAGHEHGEHDHGHDHDGHEHAHKEIDETLPPGSIPAKAAPKKKSLVEHVDKDITAILLQFKNKGVMALNFPRNINENTDLMSANPAWEINRVRDMMGTGTDVLRLIAGAIILVSAISLFISLFSSLRGRKYELALMRVMGGSRNTLLSLILLEGLLLSFIGFIIGIFLGHLAMLVLGGQLEASYKYSFTPWMWLKEEWIVLAVVLMIGLIASILPAIKASNTDISETLAS